ncbi:MAG: tetratricopeptide repeat protein [Deltaproteobacteria bacterium]|nr:tetratricopeptide repeat protein [Deltaproteobacteria bacterium]
MSSTQDTLRICEELLAVLAATETHLRVAASLQLEFGIVVRLYQDSAGNARNFLTQSGFSPTDILQFRDIGGREDTEELLNRAVLADLGPVDDDTDEQARIDTRSASVLVSQSAENVPAVPLDDGPEGAADDTVPLATDEDSIEVPAADLTAEKPAVTEAAEQETEEVVPEPIGNDDVLVMEEEEDTDFVDHEALQDAIKEAGIEVPGEEEDEETLVVDGAALDEEETVVVDGAALERHVREAESIDLLAEEEEADEASVNEVILSKEDARAALDEQRTNRGIQDEPTRKLKPKVKAARTVPKESKRKDAAAKFYAASAAIPTIRDETTPKPRAAAIQLGTEGESAQMLGDEDENEPIELGGVEDEDLLDHDSVDGFSLELEEAWDEEWEEEEEEEEEEDLIELGEDALELIDDEPQGYAPEEVEELLARAARAAKQGNIEAGVNFYSDVLDSDPDHVSAYIGRGRLYLDVGDYSRAMSDFTVAEDLAPKSPEPQVAVGDLYFARKDYRKAIEYFDAALGIEPDHAMAFCRRGISHYYRRNYKQALEDLNAAVKLDRDIPNIKTFVSMAKKKAARQK